MRVLHPARSLRWLLVVAIAGLSTNATPALGADEREPQRWAVLVGVADYDDDAIPDTPAATADVLQLARWLRTQGGLDPQHLVVLHDGGSTRFDPAKPEQVTEPLLEHLSDVFESWLPSQVQPGDEVFVFFSGQIAVAHEPVAHPVLLPRNARLAAADRVGFSPRRITRSLENKDLGALVLWIDSSLSGRRQAPDGERVDPALLDLLPAGPTTTTWLAAGPGRVARDKSGGDLGAFTDALLAGLSEGEGTLGEAWSRVVDELGKEQLPQRTSAALSSLVLRAGPAGGGLQPQVVLQAGHSSTVTAIAFDPRDRWLATGDAAGVLVLRTRADGTIYARITTSGVKTATRAKGGRGADREGARSLSGGGQITGLAVAEDGSELYASTTGGDLMGVRTADGAVLWRRRISLAGLYGVVRHGELLVMTDWLDRVRLARTRDGRRSGGFWPPGELAVAVPHQTRPLVLTVGDREREGGTADLWRLDLDGSMLRFRSRFPYQLPLTLGGPELRAGTFDATGDRVYVGGAAGHVTAYDVQTRAEAGRLPDNEYQVTELAARPESGEIAVAAIDVRLWEVGQPDARLTLVPDGDTSALAFSASGNTLATGTRRGTVQLWQAETGALEGSLPGRRHQVRDLAVGPDGRHLVVGTEPGEVAVWDLFRGRLGKVLPGHGSEVVVTRFHGDDLWTADSNGVVQRWTGEGLAAGTRWQAENGVWAVAPISRFGVALGLSSGVVQVKAPPPADLRTAQWPAHDDAVWDLLSCDGSTSVVVRGWRKLRRYDVLTGARLSGRDRASAIACTSDGNHLVAGKGNGAVDLLDLATLRRTRRIDNGAQGFSVDPVRLVTRLAGAVEVVDVAVHPSLPLVAVAYDGAPVRVWNLETGGRHATYAQHDATAVAFQEAGRLLITGSADGLVRVFDLDSGDLLASAATEGEEWFVATPDGLFDGSAAGQRRMFRWRIGDTTAGSERFRRVYYEPGLLARFAAGDRPTPAVGIIDQLPAPAVEIVSPAAGTVTSDRTVMVHVRARDQGGGATETLLTLNGRPVSEARGSRRLVPGADPELQAFEVALLPGENRLRAHSYSRTGMRSPPHEIVVVSDQPRQQGVLHVVTVGIDRYDSLPDLGFAAADAQAIADFFEPGLFSEVRAWPPLLNDGATKEAIVATLEAVAEVATVHDTLILYLAGHGLTEAGQFYFLPTDVRLAGADLVPESALSQVELGQLVLDIPAPRQLLVFDACHSGASADEVGRILASSRGPAELRKAQDDLADNTGSFVLAASTEAQFAHEVGALGHGVLTWSILDGLGAFGPPAAVDARSNTVTVLDLVQYVEDRVPALAEQYLQTEQDTFHLGSGQDFPLVAR